MLTILVALTDNITPVLPKKTRRICGLFVMQSGIALP